MHAAYGLMTDNIYTFWNILWHNYHEVMIRTYCVGLWLADWNTFQQFHRLAQSSIFSNAQFYTWYTISEIGLKYKQLVEFEASA